eukprot:CAMPEP_0175148166 /NCGR_PEP_ID=MMETSP0087-20121206/16455_1 /TAXON_ID=136419 /ORGANISM="Unknown Unknown, Strain D1" /LENGTH=298 /DNA_ID=CAMNT_0016433553 /DNA_START=27 /DNA_END=923 /DNA_ORIENTATION=+
MDFLEAQLKQQLHNLEHDIEFAELLRYWQWPSLYNQKNVAVSSSSTSGLSRSSFCSLEEDLEEETEGKQEVQEAALARCSPFGAVVTWASVGKRQFQLVVADLDAAFIRHCQFHLGCLEGVRVLHEPFQRALLDSIREEGVHTYLLFGSYEVFPCDANEDAAITGIAKAVMRACPRSWADFRDQCDRKESCNTEQERGRSFLAAPEIPNRLTLVASVAYPRDQQPSEQAAAAKRWVRALGMIAKAEQLTGLGKHTGPMPANKIRVITHAIGSFVGHNQVEVFAIGLKDALVDFRKLHI